MVSTRSSSASSSSSSKPPSKPKPLAAASSKFPYDLPYASLCLRTHPRLYRTGVGEQGVLMVEPYKSELLPSWRFKDPAAARTSSTALLAAFRAYLEEDDFVGADMARKFIQMGYTRARRYANHTGGKKYAEPKQKGVKAKQIPRLAPESQDPDKVEAARIFKAVLDDQVWTDKRYTAMREEHVQWAKQTPWPTKDDQEVQKAILHDPGQRQHTVSPAMTNIVQAADSSAAAASKASQQDASPELTARDAVDHDDNNSNADDDEGEDDDDEEQEADDNAQDGSVAEENEQDDAEEEDEEEESDEGGDVGLSYLLEDHDDDDEDDDDFEESHDEDDDDDPEIQESDDEDSTPASSHKRKKPSTATTSAKRTRGST
ncbi:hypothetical protein PaG_03907 [Moesziomyces aphidis]|uniref:DUF4385 domain containing protein n=1 Tax=Moesziomyces aphidis TaxID=84754 RepID=W3VLZ5_MOEAP|nr:hypothetical protein PaG_03907 [Moesziomyces aphidis]